MTLTATHAGTSPATRIASVDLVRGAVMALMAIDHVRVYAGVPAGGPDPAVFFTRWITHFCAPAFILLAGTSAFLYARSHKDRGPSTRLGAGGFLAIRGAWLIVLEMTLLRVAWTFNLEFARYNMAGVIWVIGWCMILLAVLIRLPVPLVGAFGVIVIAGHNVLDSVDGLVQTLGDSSFAGLWKVLYLGFLAGPISAGGNGPTLWILYSIVPWIGVMAAGYAFGAVLTLDAARRRRLCLTLGLAATALFLVLRGFNLYGNPQPWTPPDVLSFLNTNKYPASLAFLLMTLGPTIALMPWLENARGALARWLTVFGRVPFFFYVLHIPLIHALAMVVSLARTGAVDPWLFADHPMGAPPPPDGYTWSLPLLYVVWAVALVMLYLASKWFGDVKARRRDWWLRYV
jgi:uncharacterized membrane protein